LDEEVFKYFSKNYTLVCTERDNVLEQILSYGIALNRKVWADLPGKNKKEPEPPQLNSIYFDEKTFIDIANRISEYHKRKEQIKNKQQTQIIKFKS
jgi:hypothetical protein